jgi:2-oxo-4-hydroxy-4-carboxy--5-ureidoimidazoline (OHCU) decarboxylase
MHDRDPVRAAQEARARVEGGHRRHKETILGLAYDLQDLTTVAGIYRLLTIVVTLALSHEPPQLRILTTVAGLAIKLHEVGELAADVAAVKAVFQVAAAGTGPGGHPAPTIYDPESAKSLLEGD